MCAATSGAGCTDRAAVELLTNTSEYDEENSVSRGGPVEIITDLNRLTLKEIPRSGCAATAH